MQCVICPKKVAGQICKYMHARAIHNVLTQGEQYKRMGRTLPTPGQITPCYQDYHIQYHVKIRFCCNKATRHAHQVIYFNNFLQTQRLMLALGQPPIHWTGKTSFGWAENVSNVMQCIDPRTLHLKFQWFWMTYSSFLKL